MSIMQLSHNQQEVLNFAQQLIRVAGTSAKEARWPRSWIRR
jgi:hypothetical protein